MKCNRRTFLKAFGLSAAGAVFSPKWLFGRVTGNSAGRPNLVFVFGDQWRAQATGYAGNSQVKTPHLDAFAEQAVNFPNAVSSCPVCCPYRASLLTGQYPLTHGVIINDVALDKSAVSIADVYKQAGYDTAYIGKWHLNGHARTGYIPPDERQGFDSWLALGCTHNYNHSLYYAQNSRDQKVWEGYDAIAQTQAAKDYIRAHAGAKKPFILFLSWGPPHNPYQTAPKKYRDLYPPDSIKLRPNVPDSWKARAKRDIAGYYAHVTALDDCMGDLLKTIAESGIENNTICVFTSDHGDMLGSQACQRKQKPWDESIRVPFLLRYPKKQGKENRTIDLPINAPDIMPTLLGLSGVPIPRTVQGRDFSRVITGEEAAGDYAALIQCPSPFGEWIRRRGGREYRGVRTVRYTYVRDLREPWLLYDNEKDPYQQHNLVNTPEYADIQKRLDALLQKKLEETNDQFLPGPTYLGLWNIRVDETGTVRYTN